MKKKVKYNIPGQPYEIKVSGEFGSGKQIL